MSWAVGEHQGRDIGYGVPAICDHPGCGAEIDRTPDLHGPRGADIAAWLAAHPEVERYAIVDDDADMLPEQLPFFVKTEHADGLTFAAATRLAEILGIAIYDVNHPAQRLPEPTRTLDWNTTLTGE